MTGLRIAVVQHEPATGLGAFGDLLREAEVTPDVIRAGEDALPEPGALDGVIVLGGSVRATHPALAEEQAWIGRVAAEGVPYLGVCLGAQLLAAALGGRVVRARRPEIGIRQVFLTDTARRDPLFEGVHGPLTVFQWHGDTFALPRGALPLAGSIDYRNQAFRWGRVCYGTPVPPRGHGPIGGRLAMGARLLGPAPGDWNRCGRALRRARTGGATASCPRPAASQQVAPRLRTRA